MADTSDVTGAKDDSYTEVALTGAATGEPVCSILPILVHVSTTTNMAGSQPPVQSVQEPPGPECAPQWAVLYHSALHGALLSSLTPAATAATPGLSQLQAHKHMGRPPVGCIPAAHPAVTLAGTVCKDQQQALKRAPTLSLLVGRPAGPCYPNSI
jgi:hypothetical protein